MEKVVYIFSDVIGLAVNVANNGSAWGDFKRSKPFSMRFVEEYKASVDGD